MRCGSGLNSRESIVGSALLFERIGIRGLTLDPDPHPAYTLRVSAASQDNATQWDLPRNSRRALIVALVAAALLHLLALLGPWAKLLTLLTPAPPSRVQIEQVDPAKLDAIRKKWRESDKSLLLQKDKAKPKEQVEAPPDARYQSDRNIRVEKEQRARQSDVMPKPGGGGEKSRAAPQAPLPAPLPALGNLGVPLPHPSRAQQAQSPAHSAADQAFDQAILDDRLPEGSENLLNAQESVYYSFFARMYETIGPMWRSRISGLMPRPRLQPGDYTTQVDVVMDSAGNVLDVRILRSSGVPEFDQVVSSSWFSAKQFPNPPRDLLDAEGRVHTGWTFTVRLSPGLGIYFAPPERNS